MEKLLLLHNVRGEKIILGVESIINVEECEITDYKGVKIKCIKIQSRSAMVSNYYVLESIDEIFNQYKNK